MLATLLDSHPYYMLLPFSFQLVSTLLLVILLLISIKQQTSSESANRSECVDVKQDHKKNQIKSGCQQQRKNGHITWKEYFMSVAQLAAKRSKDPCTQVGACIVNEQNKIVATGYNGMPNGIHDNLVPWTKEGSFLDTKYAYVVHAELNAILNSTLTDQTGCQLYVSLFPCNECAKAIIQTGIKNVIYLSDKHKDKESTQAAKIMFKMAGVNFEQFQGVLLI